MTLTLHTAAQNSAGERVRIALNLKGLDFEYIPVSQTREAGYRQLNPQALMPTLTVDGFNIPQSLAAIEYLEDRYPTPSLLPEDPIQKAQSRGFAMAICAELHALTVRRVRKHLQERMGVGTSKVNQWYAHWTQITLSALETAIKNRPSETEFCYANYPTFADVALVPQLANARRFDCDLSAFPMLTAIEAKCSVLPAFIMARPENQIDYKQSGSSR